MDFGLFGVITLWVTIIVFAVYFGFEEDGIDNENKAYLNRKIVLNGDTLNINYYDSSKNIFSLSNGLTIESEAISTYKILERK